MNEQIFQRFRREVDQILTHAAPEVFEQFNAVYRRLREVAAADPGRKLSEELAQALVTCRRILKSVADLVYPPRDNEDPDGPRLDDSKYRDRLHEFKKEATGSDSYGEALQAEWLESMLDFKPPTFSLTRRSMPILHSDTLNLPRLVRTFLLARS